MQYLMQQIMLPLIIFILFALSLFIFSVILNKKYPFINKYVIAMVSGLVAILDIACFGLISYLLKEVSALDITMIFVIIVFNHLFIVWLVRQHKLLNAIRNILGSPGSRAGAGFFIAVAISSREASKHPLNIEEKYLPIYGVVISTLATYFFYFGVGVFFKPFWEPILKIPQMIFIFSIMLFILPYMGYVGAHLFSGNYNKHK